MTNHLVQSVEVQSVGGTCVATLPIATVDNRWVDVFIEPRAVDFVLVHDGGKAVNELIVQGIRITDSISREFGLIASAMGVHYRDEMFQSAVKRAELAKAAYSVGMCSAIAMHRLLDHVAIEDEQGLHDQVGSILKRWSKRKASLSENVKIKGNLRQHTFDFLVSPKKRQSIAISILNPTGGPLAAAERFGFRAQDIKLPTDTGPRLIAIESRSETWTPDARRIVEEFADSVIQIESGVKADFEQMETELNRIVAA